MSGRRIQVFSQTFFEPRSSLEYERKEGKNLNSQTWPGTPRRPSPRHPRPPDQVSIICKWTRPFRGADCRRAPKSPSTVQAAPPCSAGIERARKCFRLSILCDAVTVPTVCFSGVLHGSPERVSSSLRPNSSASICSVQISLPLSSLPPLSLSPSPRKGGQMEGEREKGKCKGQRGKWERCSARKVPEAAQCSATRNRVAATRLCSVPLNKVRCTCDTF